MNKNKETKKQKTVFFHVSEQELSPSESMYKHISEIDEYDDNSIQRITLQDTCDYLLADDIGGFIKAVYNKLEDKGKLYIQGSDIRQLCIALTYNMISEDILKKVLYPNKKSIHNMGEIIEFLKTVGFKITLKKYINMFEYYIEAVKNV